MPSSITGFDANGRIIPRGSNVVIPKEMAGIGDLIYKNGSSIKVIGRGTATSTSISISGTTHSLYGIIYGFVNGEAMVIAPQELGGKQWGAYVSGMPIVSPGGVLMRNGTKAGAYAQMNTARNSGYITGGSSAPLVLGSAYQATSLSSSSFASSASAEIKARYGTWEEYIRQTLRVQGAPGSPFGAVATNVKVHEFGRYIGRTYGGSQASGTALRACYDHNEGGGTWWLPSMFELGELMIDEHLNKVNENTAVADSVGTGKARWSCVLYSSGDAWSCDNYGMSDRYGFTYEVAVRPVTLLKL